jgi:hypothetical protein
MKKQTVFVLLGLAVLVFIFIEASYGRTPGTAHLLPDAVNAVLTIGK